MRLLTRKLLVSFFPAGQKQSRTTFFSASFIKYHNSKIVGLVGQDREDTDPSSSKRTSSPEA
jgi:hypothetical protein